MFFHYTICGLFFSSRHTHPRGIGFPYILVLHWAFSIALPLQVAEYFSPHPLHQQIQESAGIYITRINNDTDSEFRIYRTGTTPSHSATNEESIASDISENVPDSIALIRSDALTLPVMDQERLAGWKIALDVGHTKESPGAVSARGVGEYTYNVAFVEMLQKRLREYGAEPVVINVQHGKTSLVDRTRLAAEAGAQLFVSIHHDSVNPKYLETWRAPDGRTREFCDRFQGYSVFCSRKNPRFEQSRFLAERIGAELRQAGCVPTLHHAEKIAGENRLLLDRTTGVYEYSDLVVLKTAQIPAVLVECGVIVNREEELELQKPERRARMVDAICRALLSYTSRHPKSLAIVGPSSNLLVPPIKQLR